MPQIKKKRTKKENTQSEKVVFYHENENQEENQKETREDADPLFSLTAKNGQNYLLRLSDQPIDSYAQGVSFVLVCAIVIGAMIFFHVLSGFSLFFTCGILITIGILMVISLYGLFFSNFLYIDFSRDIAIHITYFFKKYEVSISDIKIISKEASFRKKLSEGSKAVESEELADLKTIKYKIAIGKNRISYKTHETLIINGEKFKKEIEDIQEEIKGEKINTQSKSNFLAGKGYTLSEYFNARQYFENGIKYKFLHQPVAALYTFFFYPILLIYKILLAINLIVLNLYFSLITKYASGFSGEANHQYITTKTANENIKTPTLSPRQAFVAIISHFIQLMPGFLPLFFLTTNPFNIHLGNLKPLAFIGAIALACFITILLSILYIHISRVIAKKMETSVNLPISSKIDSTIYFFIFILSIFSSLISKI
jgi:hypothetical protein